MQNLIYDEAPYDILFYDANLDAYRNDLFAGWQNHADGRRHPVLHATGTCNYTLLTDATARRSRRPRPSRRRPAESRRRVPRRRRHGGPDRVRRHRTTGSGGTNTALDPRALVAVVAIVVGGLVLATGAAAHGADDGRVIAASRQLARSPPGSAASASRADSRVRAR